MIQTVACILILIATVCAGQVTPGSVVTWGHETTGQLNLPPGLTNAIAVDAGYWHSLALKSDGSVAVWGDNSIGQTNVPANLTNIVAIAAGGFFSLALNRSGQVISWGQNYDQANLPPGLSNIVAIAAGGSHGLALKPDGTVVSLGNETSAGWSNITAIAAGVQPSLGLKEDGTVVTWPAGGYIGTIPPSVTNVVAIACSLGNCLALKSDGTLVPWGIPSHLAEPPPSIATRIAAIGGADNAWFALRTDGVPIVWGSIEVKTLPTGLNYAVTLDGGELVGMAILGDGSPVIVRQPRSKTVFSGANVVLNVGAVAAPPSAYIWRFNGTNIPGATNFWLSFESVQPVQAGAYSLAVSNANGTIVSSNATLTVNTSAPIIISQPMDQTVLLGTNATFAVTTTGSLPIDFQWQFNGTNISGANGSSLTLTNVRSWNLGDYTLVATNAYGSVISSNATLTSVPFQLTAYGFYNGWFAVLVSGAPVGTNPVIIYASTNLIDWEPGYTNLSYQGTVFYWDMSASNWPHRFYRALER